MGLLRAFFAVSIFFGGSTIAVAIEFPSIMMCLDANGNVSGGKPEDTCPNALPKCSDILPKTKEDAKKLLSMKIYGFWIGKDLDLNKTTLQEPVGKDLNQGMCSVVGHHIVYKGDRDLEFDEIRNGTDQVSTGGINSYNKKSCGSRPMMRKGGGRANGKRQLAIVFNGEYGARWSSAILGGMPWEIRAAAHKFFSSVGEKPEDLTKALKDDSLTELAEAGKQTQDQLKELLSSLPQESRAFCTSPEYKNLVGRCMGTDAPLSMTDPAMRLCQIVGVTVAMQGGGVQNAVVAQIMATANKNFQEHFKDILRTDQPMWKALEDACQKRTKNFLGMNRRKKMAKQASCFHDGDWVRVSKDWDVHDSDDSPNWIGARNRKNQMRLAFRLDTEGPETIRDAYPPSNQAPYLRRGMTKARAMGFMFGWDKWETVPATLASGFEGAVEWVIRKKVCEQSAVDSPSDACDETKIPDKPEGVKW
jgi:hypothetical protein